MLEGELVAHLGYEKHQTSENSNFRNGHSTKTIKSENGQIEIKVPRDRDSSFQPMLIKKRESFIDGIENIIISMYVKGMSTNDIEEHIREIYDYDVSTATISRITDRITNGII
jgi:transposase-like protein